MSKHKIRNKWTEENINYLKKAYLQGSPLKKIASHLNRSVSAINKALARHNLRTGRAMVCVSPLKGLKAQQFQKKKTLSGRNQTKKSKKVKSFIIESRQWVLFERVLCWLRAQKIHVIKSTSGKYYEVNGFPKNEQQILLIANLLRDEYQLPIFFVKGITNS